MKKLIIATIIIGVWGCSLGERAGEKTEKNKVDKDRKMLLTVGKDEKQSVKQYKWKVIGKFGCHGVPDVHPDPNIPDNYIITWQRYTDRGGNTDVEDVRFSIYNARTRTFTPAAYVFDPRNMLGMQGHPCWGYSHGKYRVFYCVRDYAKKLDTIVEVTADRWSDFQKYEVTDHDEPVIATPGGRPFSKLLSIDDSTAWLFYLAWWSKSPDSLAYLVFDKDKGWDKTEHFIPTSTLVGGGHFLMGSAFKEGDNIILYACGGSTGKAYKFKTSDKGKTWTVSKVIVAGITAPFRKSGDSQLNPMVVKKGDTYYMSSLNNEFHRWIAKGKDGLHFDVVKDFGKRRSLSNTMANIKGTKDILLLYCNYPDPDLSRTCNPDYRKDKKIECLIYDTGKFD